MGNFFTSLFSSGSNNKQEDEGAAKAKNEEKNFDILKYDGVRAQRMGKVAYAIKCYNEALAIKEDVETMDLLANAYTTVGDLPKAEAIISRLVDLDPTQIGSRVARIHILFMQGKETQAIADCDAVIAQDPNNALAYFLRGKAECDS